MRHVWCVFLVNLTVLNLSHITYVSLRSATIQWSSSSFIRPQETLGKCLNANVIEVNFYFSWSSAPHLSNPLILCFAQSKCGAECYQKRPYSSQATSRAVWTANRCKSLPIRIVCLMRQTIKSLGHGHNARGRSKSARLIPVNWRQSIKAQTETKSLCARWDARALLSSD